MFKRFKFGAFPHCVRAPNSTNSGRRSALGAHGRRCSMNHNTATNKEREKEAMIELNWLQATMDVQSRFDGSDRAAGRRHAALDRRRRALELR